MENKKNCYVRLLCVLLFFFLFLVSCKALADDFFTVSYYENDETGTPASSQCTTVTVGTSTKTLTIQELGFEENHRAFLGWKAYRDYDQAWYVIIPDDGNAHWITIDSENSLQEGYSFYLYGNGASVSRTAPSGEVKFFAVWSPGFSVRYYENDDSDFYSEIETEVSYGVNTKTRTVRELNFDITGRAFCGWKLYREDIAAWYIYDSNGNAKWSSSIDADTEYVIYQDGVSVARTAKQGVVRFYATWMDTTLNVTDERFGANGMDDADDRKAIQDALNVAKGTNDEIIVSIPSGNYYISDTLIVYSNTRLELDNNATIIRTNDSVQMLVNGNKNNQEPGGYGRSSGITIQGGTWDGAALNGNSAANLFYFFHAERITIKNIRMQHCCGNHFIEFAAVKNSTISGCSFSDFILHNGTDYSALENGEGPTDQVSSISSEAIQLDYSSASSSSGAKPLDNTACSDISITNCTFKNCLSGIGNHHSEIKSSGITIKNNNFSSMLNTCINLTSFNGAIVEENSATSVRRFIYGVGNNGTINVSNNIITKTLEGTSDNCIEFRNSEMIELTGNEIHGFYYGAFISDCEVLIDQNKISNNQKAGIRLRDGTRGTVSANQIREAVQNGISAAGCTDLNIIGNKIEEICGVGIHVNDYQGNIDGNYITNCDEYNIFTDGICEGNIINNTYDLGYGIVNNGNMNRIYNSNTLLGSEKEPTGYTVYYHLNDEMPANEMTQDIEYEERTKMLTLRELGFSEQAHFLGWKAFRSDIKRWRIVDADGNSKWESEVPEGGHYKLYGDGWDLVKLVPIGADVHMYGLWEHVLMLPVGLVDIQDQAFQNVGAISSVIIPNGVERIGSKAFANMVALTSVTVPVSVEYIAEDAFEGSSVTIICSSGSYAHQFATNHNLMIEIVK